MRYPISLPELNFLVIETSFVEQGKHNRWQSHSSEKKKKSSLLV
jgi:hypothetical protein